MSISGDVPFWSSDRFDYLTRSPNPRPRSTRAKGTNPRATGTNPRAKGTNPTAGLASDAARVARLKRHALARHRVATGEAWCLTCDDTGLVYLNGAGTPCPGHRQMTAQEADAILHP